MKPKKYAAKYANVWSWVIEVVMESWDYAVEKLSILFGAAGFLHKRGRI